MLTIVIACCWNKDDIKILLFAKFGLRRWDNQKELSSAVYDVYLMYCNRDYLWSQQTLLNRLESNGFRVFDKNRDTVAGHTEQQLETALSLSRRVVVVLSGNFLIDDAIIKEFYRADTHAKERGQSRYIIIVKLASENNSFFFRHLEKYRIFGRYLRTNYYADTSRRNFWRRLFYWLPTPTSPNRQDVECVGEGQRVDIRPLIN